MADSASAGPADAVSHATEPAPAARASKPAGPVVTVGPVMIGGAVAAGQADAAPADAGRADPGAAHAGSANGAPAEAGAKAEATGAGAGQR